jgi:hypothetical protein
MISLDNFSIIVNNILENNRLLKEVPIEHDVDLYSVFNNFDEALSIALEEIIPKDKIDYFYKTVYSKSMSENKIEELYNNIFNK